jgi:FkbM family methyltransferase
MVNKISVDLGHLKLGNCLYGTMLYLGPYIGKCLELTGEYSESEVSVFKAFIKPGDFVIEVGANIGSLTLPFSRLIGDDGRAFAFESQPEIFNILCANMALNRIKNVKTYNAFVADDENIETASPVWGKYAFVSDVWNTTFYQLDKLGLEKLNFMKIDVDGSELAVLKSGVEVIKKFNPVIYFENDLKDKSPELLQWIMNLGYAIYFHPAPIFREDNYYGNPANEWQHKHIVSLMMLAIPKGGPVPSGLKEVKSASDWWV